VQQVIQNLPAGVFLVMLAFAAAFVAIPLFAAFRARQEMMALAGVRTTRIAQAEEGYVRVEGHARQMEGVPVKATLTGANVVWFHSRVEDSRDPYGKSVSAGTWRTITDEESDEEFVVEDPSGSIVIHPVGARVTPTDRSIWYGATPEPEDRNPRKFGPGENPKGDGLQIEWSAGGVKRYRYTEECIYPDDPIYVQGECAERIDDEDDDDAPGQSPATGSIGKTIARPRHREPFLISTTAPDTMNEMYRSGIAGGQIIAAMFAMLVVGLLWLRFS
jgi:hypothetical protein